MKVHINQKLFFKFDLKTNCKQRLHNSELYFELSKSVSFKKQKEKIE